MSDGWETARVTQFEQRPVDARTVALRLSARTERDDAALPRPALVISDGELMLRAPAVPLEHEAHGSVELTFAVPSWALTPEAGFELELTTGGRLTLDRPVIIAAETDAAARAELAELQVWSGELERRLSEITLELSDTKSELRIRQAELERVQADGHDSEESRRLRSQLAKAHARIELMQVQARRRAASEETGDGADISRLRAERRQMATHVQTLAQLLADGDGEASAERSNRPEPSPGGSPEADAAAVGRAALAHARAQARRELDEALAQARR